MLINTVISIICIKKCKKVGESYVCKLSLTVRVLKITLMRDVSSEYKVDAHNLPLAMDGITKNVSSALS